MRYQWGFIILIIFMLMISGCTTTEKIKNPIIPSTTVPTTPTASIPPIYHIGDIVKVYPDDTSGMVILDVSQSGGFYRARYVYINDFGGILFVDYKGEENIEIKDFQAKYPVLSGNIENPQRLTVDKSKLKPKFDRGSVIAQNDYERYKGILIMEFFPQKDAYRMRFVKYIDGIWKYDGTSDAIVARADIEKYYTYVITKVEPNNLPQG